MGTVKLWGIIDMLWLGMHIKRNTLPYLSYKYWVYSRSKALAEPWGYQITRHGWNPQKDYHVVESTGTPYHSSKWWETRSSPWGTVPRDTSSEWLSPTTLKSQVTDLEANAIRWRRMLGQWSTTAAWAKWPHNFLYLPVPPLALNYGLRILCQGVPANWSGLDCPG